MTPPVSIRIALPGDLDAIVMLEAASFAADRFPRRNLRRMLTGGRTVFLVAGHDGEAAGYLALSFRQGASTARLYSVAIAPAARGKGVGRALIAGALAAARERTCRSVRLEVREGNETARKLYESCGFILRGRRENYYGDGEAALLYEATTAPSATEGAPL